MVKHHIWMSRQMVLMPYRADRQRRIYGMLPMPLDNSVKKGCVDCE